MQGRLLRWKHRGVYDAQEISRDFGTPCLKLSWAAGFPGNPLFCWPLEAHSLLSALYLHLQLLVEAAFGFLSPDCSGVLCLPMHTLQFSYTNFYYNVQCPPGLWPSIVSCISCPVICSTKIAILHSSSYDSRRSKLPFKIFYIITHIVHQICSSSEPHCNTTL